MKINKKTSLGVAQFKTQHIAREEVEVAGIVIWNFSAGTLKN